MKTGDIVRIKSIPNSKDIIKSIGKSIDGNFGFIFLEKSNTPHWESELEIHPDQIKQQQRNLKLIKLLKNEQILTI